MRERKSVYGLIFPNCVKYFLCNNLSQFTFPFTQREKDSRFQRLIDSDNSFLLHPAKLSHILELTVSCRSKNILSEALRISQ